MSDRELPPSSPSSRREWAIEYATEKAGIGENVTVRNLQDAIKAHFGKNIGQDLARQIAKAANDTTATELPVIRHRNWAPAGDGLTLMAIRSMQVDGWTVTSIKTNEDGTMTLILTPGTPEK
jgi:nucleoid-associated protein YejK